MHTILTTIAILTLLIIIGFYLLRYLKGYYTIISSEIIEQGAVIMDGIKVGQYYVIKTTYSNNRIKITKSSHI